MTETKTKALALVEKLRALHVWPQAVADDHADLLTPRQIDKLYEVGRVSHEAATLIETQAREAAAKDAEIARLRKELSDMATKYSCAVDTFNTGFSGYEAVLLHQRRIADEGPPSNWKDDMKAYAARAALAGDNHDQ